MGLIDYASPNLRIHVYVGFGQPDFDYGGFSVFSFLRLQVLLSLVSEHVNEAETTELNNILEQQGIIYTYRYIKGNILV